ncbi:MAG: hypothetical protein KatS3mg024_2686 [Armatimonadota bacterium]|nr:MAG: hypothetical protein KatS3mg024_2686 [Armatimonadota bacterium]
MKGFARRVTHAAGAAAALTLIFGAPAASHEDHHHAPHHWESPEIRSQLTGQTGILLVGWVAATAAGRLIARREKERC